MAAMQSVERLAAAASLSTSSIKGASLPARQAAPSPLPARPASLAVRASAVASSQSKGPFRHVLSGLAAAGLAAALQFSPVAVDSAKADEFAILRSDPPLESHYFDDANVLSRVTRSDLKRLLTDLENRTGYHIDVVTLRKVAGKGDVFELADRILEGWYPTLEEGDKRGVVVLVTTAKEGAVAGGPTFLDAIGDDVLEGVVSENLPVLATEEKYNEAIYSTAKRLVAKIDGLPDIPGPQFDDGKRESNYRTREQTEEKRSTFTLAVGGLLVIAFVVPMAQYYAYVARK